MELTFEKQNNFYVSEFQITSDANLHIEKSTGKLQLFQRTIGAGDYAEVKDFNTSDYDSDKIIDIDLQSLVYPKWIKIKSAVKPNVSVVTFATSGGNGGGTVPAGDDIITIIPGTYDEKDELITPPAELNMTQKTYEFNPDFAEMYQMQGAFDVTDGYDFSLETPPTLDGACTVILNSDNYLVELRTISGDVVQSDYPVDATRGVELSFFQLAHTGVEAACIAVTNEKTNKTYKIWFPLF